MKCAERGCKTLEMTIETVEIQERYTKKAIRATRAEENETSRCLKVNQHAAKWLYGSNLFKLN